MTTWDERKRRSNLAKHGLDFALIEKFNWADAVFEEDDSAHGEQREKATSWIGAMLYVYIYTLRGDEDHAISLRKATRQERRRYALEVSAAHRR